jgi:hypothetical protein
MTVPVHDFTKSRRITTFSMLKMFAVKDFTTDAKSGFKKLTMVAPPFPIKLNEPVHERTAV